MTDSSLGQALATRRESLNLSVELIAQRMRLNPAYIRAIEADQQDQLPDGYARIFIKSYMRQLNCESDPDMQQRFNQFFDVASTVPAETESVTDGPAKHWRNRVPDRVEISPELRKVIVWMPFVIIFALLVYVASEFIETAPDSPVKEMTVDEALKTLNADSMSVAERQVTVNDTDSMRLVLNVLEPVFIFVYVDSARQYRVRADSNQTLRYQAESQFNLYIADGGKVRITFNDSAYGTVTAPNVRVNSLIFNRRGLIERLVSPIRSASDSRN